MELDRCLDLTFELAIDSVVKLIHFGAGDISLVPQIALDW